MSKAQTIGGICIHFQGAEKLENSMRGLSKESLEPLRELLVDISQIEDKDGEIKLLAEFEKLFDIRITTVDSTEKIGYGRLQKIGFDWAIERDFDAVVLLQGSDRASLSLLPDLFEPILTEGVDFVIGSRFAEFNEENKRAMPLYKYYGNRLLRSMGNKFTPISLSDWNSSYRAFSIRAIKSIPFKHNSDEFIFDVQVLIQLAEIGYLVKEIPIQYHPSNVINLGNGFQFTGEVLYNLMRYRAHKVGFGSGSTAFNSLHYDLKEDANASHKVIESELAKMTNLQILDLGCSDGRLGREIEKLGHKVYGVDFIELPEVRNRITEFHLCDLESELPASIGGPFDVILAADVLEHLRDPQQVLKNLSGFLKPAGRVVVSVPNIGHWYGRLKIGLGLFDYDRRGIFDSGHLRFFTKTSFKRMVEGAGFSVTSVTGVGLPLSVLDRGASSEPDNALSFVSRFMKSVFVGASNTAIKMWPSLFSYQMVSVLAKKELLEPEVTLSSV